MDYDSKREHFHRPKFPELFESPKIMFSGVSGGNDKILGCYDENGYYTNHNINHAVLWTPEIRQYKSPSDYEIDEEVSKYDLKYVSGNVNSKLTNYYFTKFLAAGTLQGSYSSIYPENIRSLPVCEINFEDENTTPSRKFIDEFSQDIKRNEINNCEKYLKIVDPQPTKSTHEILTFLTEQIMQFNQDLADINLHLPDYLGNYSEGPTLADLPSTPPEGLAESLLTATASGTDRFETIRVTDVEIERDGDRLTLSPVPYVKPVESVREEYETNSHGYATLDPIPAMVFHDLDPAQANLIEAFVPHAVGEAGGYAGFRDGATKTISLLDRLESLTLPALEDVRDGLDDYRDAVERAAELDEKIERTDDLIDEIVYELYGLTDEEIEIVEETVGG
jgi:hypothetical protein